MRKDSAGGQRDQLERSGIDPASRSPQFGCGAADALSHRATAREAVTSRAR